MEFEDDDYNTDDDYHTEDEDVDFEDDQQEDEFEDSESDISYSDQTKSSGNEVEDDYKYKVLSAEEIMENMNDCIKEVNGIVQLPTSIIRVLLNHFNWNRDKLIERYYDGDQEKLLTEVKVINTFKSHEKSINESNDLASRTIADQPDECEICFLPVSTNMMTGIQCGHIFCTSCWSNYLTTKIMDGGTVDMISCAGHGCDVLLNDETIMKLIEDPEVKLKYQVLSTNTFVESNRLFCWCNAKNCGNAIKVERVDVKPVKCKCDNVMCSGCGQNWHSPILCKYFKKWIKKCNDDSETANWIGAYTKECPKCQATIEKNGGCNHMKCHKCKYDYCWVCAGPWDHGNYNCNKFNETTAQIAKDAQSDARTLLDRYLFYCNRYLNHMNSLRFEHKIYTTFERKIIEWERMNVTWIDIEFLYRAVEALHHCRQTLMYTYAFAYYLEKNNQSIIFEENQNDLEKATENLSEYLERDILTCSPLQIKDKVQDTYRYCESRHKILIDHVTEGYRKNLWLHQDKL